MNIKEVLKKLPGSWSELKLKDFIRFSKVEINDYHPDSEEALFQTIDVLNQPLSILTGIPIEELNELPFSDHSLLLRKLSFLNSKPEPDTKTSIKWKNVSDISYDNFVVYMQNYSTTDLLLAYPAIIKAFSKDKLTEEEILEMDMQDVVNGFFLHRKQARKYLNTSIKSTALQLAKVNLKAILSKQRWQKQEKLSNNK